MKKLLTTAAIALTLSSNALAADYVRPMQYDNPESMFKWAEVLKKQPVKAGSGKPTLAKLMDVFSKAGGIQYVEDYKQYDKWYKQPNPRFDYWATPAETLKNKAGDCEDFALLWYYAAREAGFKPEQMAVVVGFLPKQESQGHAILAAEVEGVEYVLDSYSMTIKPSEYYTEENFQVLYRVNENGWGVK